MGNDLQRPVNRLANVQERNASTTNDRQILSAKNKGILEEIEKVELEIAITTKQMQAMQNYIDIYANFTQKGEQKLQDIKSKKSNMELMLQQAKRNYNNKLDEI